MSMPPQRVNSPDDFQTPPYAVTPLLPYLSRKWRIWEPACGKGNIVRTLCSAGFCCFGTDIMTGVDFLKHTTNGYAFDAIVTNPPFSGKLKEQFLQRCYEIGKPFALLMPLTALEGRVRQDLYKKYGLEILIPSRRIAFETPTGLSGSKSSPQFTTAWYTWGLGIGKELSFVEMPK